MKGRGKGKGVTHEVTRRWLPDGSRKMVLTVTDTAGRRKIASSFDREAALEYLEAVSDAVDELFPCDCWVHNKVKSEPPRLN